MSSASNKVFMQKTMSKTTPKNKEEVQNGIANAKEEQGSSANEGSQKNISQQLQMMAEMPL